MRALALALLALASCRTGAGMGAAGAIANVGMATAVGGVRMASGECFTVCAPGTICNPKTRACDPLPCHDRCGPNERCDMTGSVDKCVPAGEMEVQQKHETKPAPALPVGVTPPLSSSPPSSPEHPDVPTR